MLWLGFFYLMDRHEPEPKQLVVGVCVLGALVAAPLADFVQYQAVPPVALEVARRCRRSRSIACSTRCSSSGLAQEMCKYAVVRYTIYMSREFDEPMDGIVYMMACGTGFAVWVNYHRLSGQGHQVILSTGAAQAVVTTLAHASFAGVLGYVMGRAKFSRRSAARARHAAHARPARRGRAQRPVRDRRELDRAERAGAAPVARRRLRGAVRRARCSR